MRNELIGNPGAIHKKMGDETYHGRVENCCLTYIKGWFFELENKEPNFFLIIDGNRYDINPSWHTRDDVAETFGSYRLNSGFTCNFPLTVVAKLIECKLITPDALYVNSNYIENYEISDNEKNKKILLQKSLCNSYFPLNKKIIISEYDHKCEVEFIGVIDLGILCRIDSLDFEVNEIFLHINGEILNANYWVEENFIKINTISYLWKNFDEQQSLRFSISFNSEIENQFEIILEKDDVEGLLASAVAISYMKNDERGKLNCIDNLLAFGRLEFLDKMVLSSLREIIKKYGIAKEAKIFDLPSSKNLDLKPEFFSENRRLIKAINGQLETEEDLEKILIAILDQRNIGEDDFKSILKSIIPLACRQRQIIKILPYFDKLNEGSLINETDIWSKTILIPLLVIRGDYVKATEIMYQIVYQYDEGWISYESVEFAVEYSIEELFRGNIDYNFVEEFLYSVLDLLEKPKSDWFSRSHDYFAVKTMQKLAKENKKFTNYLSDKVIDVSLSSYGLNPLFWNFMVKDKCIQELDRAYEHWIVFERMFDNETIDFSKAILSIEFFNSDNFFA